MKYWGFLAALGALVGSACGRETGIGGSAAKRDGASSPDGSVGRADAATATDGGAGAPTPIEACPGGVMPPASDPVDINRFAIDKDTMTIEVHGGCSVEEFGLCYLREVGMSLPASANVYVLYKATRVCDPAPDLTLAFDLRPFADFLSPQGTVVSMTVWTRDESGKAISHGSALYRWGDS